MSEESTQSRNLSHISHLFLSSVRERQTDGAPRPQRQPPRPAAQEPPPTAAELRQALSHTVGDQEVPLPTPPVRAMITAHLGAAQFQMLKDYAATLAATGQRVGLIVIDASQLRLMTFVLDEGEANGEEDSQMPRGIFEPRAMRDAINELSCDLDCWLLAIANPRLAEGRALLKQLPHWTVLCPGDHEGIVACYRMLKGLAELHPSPLGISLSVVQAHDPTVVENVFSKMAGVCQQFLNWKLQSDLAVDLPRSVAQCTVLNCQAERDKAQLANGPHWQVISELVQRASHAAAEAAFETTPQEQEALAQEHATAPEPQPLQEMPAAEPATGPRPWSFAGRVVQEETPFVPPPAPAVPVSYALPLPAAPISASGSQPLQVVDLADEADPQALLDAVIKHAMDQIVPCPLRAPMCPQARLAVGRDHRLTLVALAESGLPELRSIALAYRWMAENRQLLAMALPQFAIDAHQMPMLRLLVEQGDMDAQVLYPLFQVNTVLIDSYRRVRWGQRMGLLLAAA